jgi:hypothetical protein
MKKMNKTVLNGVVLLSFIAIVGCASHRISVIESCEYDAEKNETEYLVFPFGKVSLPGKWEKLRYSDVSGQQFFIGQDATEIAVAFYREENYEFNKDGKLRGLDFLNAFYEWETSYFKTKGYESQLIELNPSHQYIIYRIYGEKVNSYFLIGVNSNGNVSNFSVAHSNKWTEDEKVVFLKNLFLQ